VSYWDGEILSQHHGFSVSDCYELFPVHAAKSRVSSLLSALLRDHPGELLHFALRVGRAVLASDLEIAADTRPLGGNEYEHFASQRRRRFHARGDSLGRGLGRLHHDAANGRRRGGVALVGH
jgi:hypothetical protein